MRAARLQSHGDGWVRLQLPKGVLVIFTTDEYVRALLRGKAERRTQRRAIHTHQRQISEDADHPDWSKE